MSSPIIRWASLCVFIFVITGECEDWGKMFPNCWLIHMHSDIATTTRKLLLSLYNWEVEYYSRGILNFFRRIYVTEKIFCVFNFNFCSFENRSGENAGESEAGEGENGKPGVASGTDVGIELFWNLFSLKLRRKLRLNHGGLSFHLW